MPVIGLDLEPSAVVVATDKQPVCTAKWKRLSPIVAMALEPVKMSKRQESLGVIAATDKEPVSSLMGMTLRMIVAITFKLAMMRTFFWRQVVTNLRNAMD